MFLLTSWAYIHIMHKYKFKVRPLGSSFNLNAKRVLRSEASKTAKSESESESEAGPQAIDTIIHTDFRCQTHTHTQPLTRHTLIVNI